MGQGDPEATFRRLALALKGRAQVGELFDRRLAASVELLEHNEAVVAFENLVSNIYEFDVAISLEELEAIGALASAWCIDDARWSFVRELVQ